MRDMQKREDDRALAGLFELITVLEATQGQMHGFVSQLSYKCLLKEWALGLRFAPGLPLG